MINERQIGYNERVKTIIREIAITLGLALILYLGLTFLVQNSPVIGSSMEPSLLVSGQRLMVSRVTYWIHAPQRGDIITFHPPKGWYNPTGRPFIKRIIALPGETVEIKNGKVYVNETPLDEPYLAPGTQMTRTMASLTVPEDCYFVLGDNRNVSEDSSYYRETISRSGIIGKAWLSIWPPRVWGLAPNYSDYVVEQSIPSTQ
jgi:signal peptidase I